MSGLCGKGLKSIIPCQAMWTAQTHMDASTLYHIMTRIKPLENVVGKGEKAGDWHFLLFLQCFLPSPFEPQWNCRLQMVSVWKRLNFCRLVKGETHVHEAWLRFIFVLKNFRSQVDMSLLLPYLLSHNLPRGFLSELIHTTHKDTDLFRKVDRFESSSLVL